MKWDLHDPETGRSIAQVIASVGSAPDDFEQFSYHFIGMDFGFAGAELDEFVALCIKAALKNGCVPVGERLVDKTRDPPVGDWLPTYAFGVTDDEIAAGMIAAWHALGRDPEWGELMFSWEDWIDPAAFAEWTARRHAAASR